MMQIYHKKLYYLLRLIFYGFIFRVNDVALVFLLLTLNLFHTCFSVSIADFEQVNVS